MEYSYCVIVDKYRNDEKWVSIIDNFIIDISFVDILVVFLLYVSISGKIYLGYIVFF